MFVRGLTVLELLIWKRYVGLSVCLAYEVRFRFIHLMSSVVGLQWVAVALLPRVLQPELLCYELTGYGHL